MPLRIAEKIKRSIPESGMLLCMSGDEETGQVLAAKFQAIFPHLDERQRLLLPVCAHPARDDPLPGP